MNVRKQGLSKETDTMRNEKNSRVKNYYNRNVIIHSLAFF